MARATFRIGTWAFRVATIAACLLMTSGGLSAARPQSLEVAEASITELQAAMEAGIVTSVDLVDAYLARIVAYDQRGPRLNAIVTVNPRAREEAAALDRERSGGSARGPLHGIPIILKDNYDTGDMPTTAGSIALAGFVPARDGFQVRRLREAGAVVLAKSNLHEMAMGITTVSSVGGQTLNPYDLGRNPGGSSGGTGSAIAASFGAAGMGSDTCGSIRIPSSQNNLVGLRPTKGLSSIAGIVPFSHTQDVGGPLTRNVADLAIVLDATVGSDPDDPATAILDDYELAGFSDSLDAASLTGARFGKLNALFESDAAEDAMIEVIDEAIAHIAAQGAEIIDVTVPGLQDLTRAASVINYEFKYDFIDYLAANPGAPVTSLDDVLERGLYHQALGSRFRFRNGLGTRDGADYLAALEWRSILRDAVVQVMDDNNLDALLYPTMVSRPSRLGEPQGGSTCSLAPNSGLPAISVPAGFTDDLLPVGLEILGRPLADTRLVSFAYAFEQSTDHRRAPAVTPPLVNAAAPTPLTSTVRVDLGPDTEVGIRPFASATFIFDPIRSTLQFDIEFVEIPTDQLHGATLHIGANGPAFASVAAATTLSSEGSLDLTPVQRQAVADGETYLRVFAGDAPTDTAPISLSFQRP